MKAHRNVKGCVRGMVLMASLFAVLPELAAAEHARRLTGAEIKTLFTGATVSGRYLNGGPFSEYHSPDGRALGDNGFAINVDACWNVEQDRICYHYGAVPDRRTYCFAVEKGAESYTLRVATTDAVNAVATIEPGNARSHHDGGKRWSCEDLLSATKLPPRVADR